MSKLYLTANSDARKTGISARVHSCTDGRVLYNWNGSNNPEGTALSWEVRHCGDTVRVYVDGVIFKVIHEDGRIEKYIGGECHES